MEQDKTVKKIKEPYFVKDKEFFKSLFRIMVVVSLQNLINYSVNMADNMMIGNYGQAQLSGVSCVSMIFFLLNAFAFNFGNSFGIPAAQFWGQKRTDKINRLGGILLKVNIFVGLVFFIICWLLPYQLLGLFTTDQNIIEQGVMYLGILKWTFIPYMISTMLMDLMRNVETVSIALYISITSFFINVVGNYLLIFGKLGCPELGVKGAAISTLIARVVELCILIVYVLFIDKKLHFFKSDFYKHDSELEKIFAKMAIQIAPAGLAWSIATPVQTALLGRMAADAIAANSVTTTFYQLLKVVAQAMSAASAVIVGKTVGEISKTVEKNFAKVRAAARTIEAISLGIGIMLGFLLFLGRNLIVSFYKLTPEAESLTRQMIIIMCFVMVGMAYEVPVLFGTIRAGGDAKFTSMCNLLVLWCIVMPLAFMAVFWWKLDIIPVVIIIQSEQILKCIPAAIRVRQYDKWIKVIAK